MFMEIGCFQMCMVCIIYIYIFLINTHIAQYDLINIIIKTWEKIN